MLTRIQKWGNSLGLRIPKFQAEEVGVEPGSTVDISTRDGEIVVRPVSRRQYTLESLLRKVTRKNLHEEVDWGEPTGREAL
jgi:antitoxin MazE